MKGNKKAAAGFRIDQRGRITPLSEAEVRAELDRVFREALEQLRPPQRPTLH